MTPEKAQRLKACIQEIAAILYEQTKAKELTTLESIEKTVRQQMLEHVSRWDALPVLLMQALCTEAYQCR